MLSPARRFLKLFHPEGIPWPGSALYNAVSQSGIFQRQYELVARDVVSCRSAGNVLDIGTGPAWLLLSLHRQAPALRLTGLDISAPMVAKARSNVAKAGLSSVIEIREGNASDLPFPDASFDMVLSTGAIHHWKDPTAGLNEVFRVLKDGGDALMYDIVSDTPAGTLKEAKREFGKLRVLLFWLHGFEEPFYTRHNFELLARHTHFKAGRTRFVGVLCCLALRKGERRG